MKFSPQNQVEMIQSQIVEVLQSIVGGEDKLEVKNGYQNMEEN